MGHALLHDMMTYTFAALPNEKEKLVAIFGYLAAIKTQNGAAMLSVGRL